MVESTNWTLLLSRLKMNPTLSPWSNEMPDPASDPDPTKDQDLTQPEASKKDAPGGSELTTEQLEEAAGGDLDNAAYDPQWL